MWIYTALVLLSTLSAVEPAEPSVANESERMGQDSLLRFGQPVRIQAAALGGGWHDGVVGDVAGCMVILVPVSRSGGQVTEYRPVPIDAVSALQRASTAHPSSARRWVELAIPELRRRHGGCGLPGS